MNTRDIYLMIRRGDLLEAIQDAEKLVILYSCDNLEE